MSMNKKEFRKNQIQKLQKLSKTWEKKLDELNLYKELFKTTEWEKADNVAITLSEDRLKELAGPKTKPEFTLS